VIRWLVGRYRTHVEALPRSFSIPIYLASIRGEEKTKIFEVWNSGGDALAYSISDSAGWLTCDVKDGISTGEHQTVSVTYSTAGLSPGTYSAKITIGGLGSNSGVLASKSPRTIPVTLTVNAQEPSVVREDPGWRSFSGLAGELLRLDLNITNSRGDAFNKIKAEWLVFTGTVGGVQLPIFVLTSEGQIFDIRNVQDFNAVTYSFNHSSSDVATLAILALGSLGFRPGDTFVYG